MFANSYWDAKQIVTVEYFENGNEPMVTVGYDIYAKNISQGKELKQNLILALTVSSNHFQDRVSTCWAIRIRTLLFEEI